jgi:hypothetical protein
LELSKNELKLSSVDSIQATSSQDKQYNRNMPEIIDIFAMPSC